MIMSDGQYSDGVAAGVKRRRSIMKDESAKKQAKKNVVSMAVKTKKRKVSKKTKDTKKSSSSSQLVNHAKESVAKTRKKKDVARVALKMKSKRGLASIKSEGSDTILSSSSNDSSFHFTRDQLLDGIRLKKFRKIVFLLGAGISCAAGVPDFRTKGAGLYSQMQRQGFPHPEELFDLECFLEDPEPFYQVANRYLRFDGVKPVKAHHFVRACHDAGQLLMAFTQNIDSLELAAGLPADKLVQAHGHMRAARCCRCKKEVDMSDFDGYLRREEVMKCPYCNVSASKSINAIVKPDIIFFGEKLTKGFQGSWRMVNKAHLVIVMGTSLKVKPFSQLVKDLPDKIPLVVLNMENPGIVREKLLVIPGDIEESISSLCTDLGWEGMLS